VSELESGLFLQTDPVPPRPEEMNAYVYVGNNPLNRVDPYGLGFCDPFSQCTPTPMPDSTCPSGVRIIWVCTDYRCAYVDYQTGKGYGCVETGKHNRRGNCTDRGAPT
jgi:hypothetical protein